MSDRGVAPDSWFRGAGLGIFIHWDHASQQGVEISWPIVGWPIRPGRDDTGETISAEQYYSSAATFNPVEWDAPAVARMMADAGATYAVFTAKHHGGYTMFHSAHSDFGVENGQFGRDILREFIDAIRAEGMRVGVYMSLPDWHDEDYPAFRDSDRPYPFNLAEGNGGPDLHRRPTPQQWERFMNRLRGQLTEILTDYGQIDLLWFDGEWERTETEWDAAALRSMIRSLQPEIIINDRLPGNGDYETPEQGMPRQTPEGPWEMNLTIGDMWAYRPHDDPYAKSARSIVARLIEVASRGGNLLLNIAPTGTGAIQPIQQQRLAEIGAWMSLHEHSVRGVSPAPDVDFYGPVTRRGTTIYLHLLALPVESVLARGIPVERVEAVTLLATGESLQFTSRLEVHQVAEEDEVIGEIEIVAPAPSGALIDVVAIRLRD